MNSQSDKPLREIFLEAAEIDDLQARADYLDKTCAGKNSLRWRVEALLAAEIEAGASSDDSESVPSHGDAVSGMRLGHYKLLEQIGEGGCGVVYMAEQEQPVRRKVALKIIKLGMDTRQVVARFEAERQALAMMDHPNIAQVFDAGATEWGRPYFVMELVRGIKITEYCDRNRFSTRQRLELFMQVCHAVQHAHQKGIIHRDLKPTNILVTELDGTPLPKVIDFGIAKAVEGRLTDQTLFTTFQQFLGTPAYMSPEQAALTAVDIDTRSDIYSLGVLLYELLTGQTPFDTKALLASGMEGMCRTIRQKEPPRPNTRLRQARASAQSKIANRKSQIDPDLDWIVMKCLEKDRRRRYETANGLAMDLRHHLDNQPVTARPPSRRYRIQKTFRRNKLGFAALGSVTAALVIGMGVATSQFVEKSRAYERAASAEQEQIRLRQEAETQELAARQRAYASDMNVAKLALDGNNLGRARDLLDRHRPEPGRPDLRGWEWRYLWQQTRSDAILSLCRKPNGITALAVSHDGRWLGVGVAYNTGMSVWDLQSRQELVRLSEAEEHVRAAFSPAGPLLAYAGVDVHASGERQSHLRLWNVTARQEIAEIRLDSECMGLAFSRDGRTLVTSTSSGVEGTITIWRVPEGSEIVSYPSEQFGLELNPTGFAVTPELSVAAYGAPQGRIRVVDLRDGKPLWEAVASRQLIAALAFSPDGKTLASAAGFGESDIRLWEVATGKQIGHLEHHAAHVDSLVFTHDGGKLASASGDQTIGLWDVTNGTDFELLEVLRGHRQEVWRLELLPDGKILVSGAKDGEVCLWDLSAARSLRGPVTISEKIRDWVLGPDGRSVLTVAPEGQVAQWSGRELHQKEVLLNVSGDSTRVFKDSFSPRGRFLAAGSTNGNVQIWNLSRRALERELTHNTGRPVSKLKFIEDESTLLTYSEDHQLHLWDVATGREVRSWPAVPGFENVADASDKKHLLEFALNGAVRMKNLTDGQTTERRLDFIQTQVATFSPDKKLFAVASHDGYARVWDTATWKETATLGGYLLGLDSVAFSPDGRRLATGGGSNVQEALRLWDVTSWQDVLTLECEGAHFIRAKFSPDGDAISLMDYTGILTIWRAPTWKEIEAAERASKRKVKTIRE